MIRRGGYLPKLLTTILVVLALYSAPALAQKRFALVVGNNAYANLGADKQLNNAISDARLMRSTLQALGFEVLYGENLDRRTLVDRLFDLTARLGKEDTAFFFFAGHGVSFSGANYLLPSDVPAPLATGRAEEGRLAEQAIAETTVIDRLTGAGARVAIVVLDACRDNPLQASDRRSVGATRGLAQAQPARGIFSIYSAGFGQTALDRLSPEDRNPNSVFTRVFVEKLKTPGLDIRAVATQTRRVVVEMAQTVGHDQFPAYYDQVIGGDVYLAGLPSGSGSPATAQPAPTPPPAIAAAPPPAQPIPPAEAPRAGPSQADVATLFRPFDLVLDLVRTNYVEKPYDRGLLSAASAGILKAFPSAQKVSIAGKLHELPSNATKAGTGKIDLQSLYAAATEILSETRTSGDDARLVTAAIDAMLAQLDPHSGYLDARQFRDMQTQTRGEFGGVGMEVTMEDGLVRVVTPLDDTPAAKAGIRAGDVVTRIDDQQVLGLSLNQAVGKLRGPVKSNVRLTVTRKGEDKPIEIVVTRDIVRVIAVRSRIEGNDVGYVRLTQFNESTTESLGKAISEITTQVSDSKLRGYIIDLRSNPGGLLDQAVAVCDLFMERGEIVAIRGRNADDVQRFSARAGDVTKGKRIVVLINGGSAAAAEIMAGALQDHKRATIIGTRSFGKGSVQTIFPLGGDNGALRLTTARYTTPSGRSIQTSGIAPDIKVVQDKGQGPEPDALQSYIPQDIKDDKALQRALDLLRTAQAKPAR